MKNRATKMEKGEQQIERVRRLSALHNEFERDQPVARAVEIGLGLATLRELRGGFIDHLLCRPQGVTSTLIDCGLLADPVPDTRVARERTTATPKSTATKEIVIIPAKNRRFIANPLKKFNRQHTLAADVL